MYHCSSSQRESTARWMQQSVLSGSERVIEADCTVGATEQWLVRLSMLGITSSIAHSVKQQTANWTQHASSWVYSNICQLLSSWEGMEAYFWSLCQRMTCIISEIHLLRCIVWKLPIGLEVQLNKPQTPCHTSTFSTTMAEIQIVLYVCPSKEFRMMLGFIQYTINESASKRKNGNLSVMLIQRLTSALTVTLLRSWK